MLDSDRVLKNEINESVVEYINDQIGSFNDMQLIRALVVLSMSSDVKHLKTKDRVTNLLLTNVLNGKFEIKKGNTLAAFAQAVNMNHTLWFGAAEDIFLESYTANRMKTWQTDLMQSGTAMHLPYMYYRLVKIANMFKPFLKHYFTQYKPSQKLVVLRML